MFVRELCSYWCMTCSDWFIIQERTKSNFDVLFVLMLNVKISSPGESVYRTEAS